MGIWNLATANIRKSKGSAISLMVLILVATLLLNVGLSIFTKVKPLFQDKVEELHAPHAVVILQKDSYKPSYADYMLGRPGVMEVETEAVLRMGLANIQMGGGNEVGLGVALMNKDQARKVAPLKLKDSINVSPEEAIYVPFPLMNSGYELGDTLVLRYLESEYRYTIAGYYESTVYSMVNAGILKFFLEEPAYEQLERRIGGTASSMMMSIRMEEPEQSSQLLRDFKNDTSLQVSGEGALVNWNTMDYTGMEMTSTMMISIFAMIIVAFSWIIVIVGLIVIRFRVLNSIEDQMVNLGALGALGYTSRQLIASMLLQFMMTGVVGAVLGTLLCYAITPGINRILTNLAGFQWERGFRPDIDIISLVVVLALVAVVTLLASRRIKRLPPVTALRGGVHTHSFRKNHIPLATSRGRLQFLLALKSMAANMKQNFIVMVIVAGVTFAAVFSIIMYLNVAVDKQALYNMAGSEMADVVVHAHPNADEEALYADLKRHPGVAKTNKLDVAILTVEEEEMAVYFSDDYSRMENLAAYEGRMPQYDNEIVITGVMADMFGIGIGNLVEVDRSGDLGKYLVTGLTQTMNNGGRIAYMTIDGLKQLNPDYNIRSFYLYLDNDVSIDAFNEEVRLSYAGQIAMLDNYRELGEAQLGTYTTAITSLMAIVLVVTAIVVGLILYLVIQTVILKRKRDFGIYKGLGYTSMQLMTQIGLSFLPVVALGAGLGVVLGSLGTNPLLSTLLYSVGISNAMFNVNFSVVLMLGLSIVLFAYLVSLLAARKIRSISAYGLITE